MEHVAIWPASHYNVREGMIDDAVAKIGAELNARCIELEAEGKPLESAPPAAAHPVRHGRCSRKWASAVASRITALILDGRKPGERPYCLLDYFPEDFVCFIDESHQTVPQIGGMAEGDRVRKQTLVDYGFRLPSALDNRPQTFRSSSRSRRRSCSSPQPPVNTSGRTRCASSSRSCDRPASSIRRSTCGQQRVRSMT